MQTYPIFWQKNRLVAAVSFILFLYTTSLLSSAQAQSSLSRGYTTTPQELQVIAQKANDGIEPYQTLVAQLLEIADERWDYRISGPRESCRDADDPEWIDNDEGAGVIYAKAIAYHLTGEEHYAGEVALILELAMTNIMEISEDQQCRLNFAWGTPELVASADLIEEYWHDLSCVGPASTEQDDLTLTTGTCKVLFQNWLARNVYYTVSLSGYAQSNWGAAANNTLAYISDYLWDRPDIRLVHRRPEQLEDGQSFTMSPAEAFQFAKQNTINRMNGYGVEYHSSSSCDMLDGDSQSPDFEPVKSQFTPDGIIPEDARREEFCNIPRYNGEYQNYPQVHINNTIQHCELLYRRGDTLCYDNIDMKDIPDYSFIGPDGEEHTVHLKPGRGSIVRAINAIIIDSDTEWRHDDALVVAYRYYSEHVDVSEVSAWYFELDLLNLYCSQGICFGMLTHGFAPEETFNEPPIVAPPGA